MPRRFGDIMVASPQALDVLRDGGLLISCPSERHLKRLSAQESGMTGLDLKRYEAFNTELGDLPAEKAAAAEDGYETVLHHADPMSFQWL